MQGGNRIFILILFGLIAVLGGTNFYLAHRSWRWIHCFVPNLSIAAPLTFFIIMTIMMLLSFVRPFNGTLQRVISVIGTFWMGVFAYLTLFFLISDIVVLIPWLFRLLSVSALARLRLVAGIGATAIALSVSIYGFYHAQRLYTVEYDIQLSDKTTSQMNVVFISDVHLGAVGSEARLERIVTEINSLSPDLVCIAGDFFDTDFYAISDPEKAIETMAKIQSRYGVYSCLGNHDSGKTLQMMEDFYVRAGVKLLKDEYTVIDNRLVLAGRLDLAPINNVEKLQRSELSKVLEGADMNLPVVVLDHNPKSVDTYNNEVNLVLSGHTHKGQIFPGSLITDAIYTVDYGYHRTENGTQVIVSSGAGTWGLPMRVGTNCEIVKINLEF